MPERKQIPNATRGKPRPTSGWNADPGAPGLRSCGCAGEKVTMEAFVVDVPGRVDSVVRCYCLS